MILAIHHKSLRSVLYPSDMYMRDPSASDVWDPTLWDPSVSDLWDLTAYVSCLLMGPFSISIQPVGPDRLHHCTRCLVVLTYLWSPYSSIFSMWMPYRLTYISDIHCKWKQICACWTYGGGGSGGSSVCYAGLGVLLEARRGATRWSAVALASVSVVCHDHCSPKRPFSPFKHRLNGKQKSVVLFRP
jgi:hypothetical protein